MTEFFVIARQDDRQNRTLAAKDLAAFGSAGMAEAVRWHTHFSTMQTPLWALPGLADGLGVGAIHVKDERTRLGLGSFKALGGGFAVAHAVLARASAQTGRSLGMDSLFSEEAKTAACSMTFVCATAGNHGRSVAAAANALGARTIVFIPQQTAQDKVDAIAARGAEVNKVAGNYDDAVAEAELQGDRNGWTLLSDTASSYTDDGPRNVMQGYGVLAAEALKQLRAVPTHVFLQAGVGGLAAAVSACLSLACLPRPKFIVVEPSRAPCLLECARAGAPLRIPADEHTNMAMLECYEPSWPAWAVLAKTADAFMTVDDEEAAEAVQYMGAPEFGDPIIASTPSGACGLAGLLKLMRSRDYAQRLELEAEARVLVINTEG